MVGVTEMLNATASCLRSLGSDVTKEICKCGIEKRYHGSKTEELMKLVELHKQELISSEIFGIECTNHFYSCGRFELDNLIYLENEAERKGL